MANSVVWQLNTPTYRASGTEPAMLVEHLKIASVKLESKRTSPLIEKTGQLDVWIVPTLQDAAGDWYEPPIGVDHYIIAAAEYAGLLGVPFPEGTESFGDIEAVVYAYLSATNRIPPGQVVTY